MNLNFKNLKKKKNLVIDQNTIFALKEKKLKKYIYSVIQLNLKEIIW
jgi:hypothetical protein